MNRTRKIIAAGAITLAAVGGGVGAGLAVSGGTPATLPPAQVLQADGYPLVMTLSADQLKQFASGTDVSPYIVSAVVGMKDGKVEIVAQLTDQGKNTAELNDPSTISRDTPGATAHFDGNDLTVVMPSGSLFGDQAPAQGDQGYDYYPGM